MVFYFSPSGHVEGGNDWLIYMGKDKFENEELIKYGLPEDVWFHVDKLSSAHVYLRLPRGKGLSDIPENVLEECCQLVKQNSIEGCKQNNVDIVYTKWSNLKKTQGMVVGQVGFHKENEVKKCTVEKKKNDILNRLNKTKQEAQPDLAAQRLQYDQEMSHIKKQELQVQKAQEKAAAEQKRKEADQRSYKTLMDADSMISNKNLADQYANAEEYEDDFM